MFAKNEKVRNAFRKVSKDIKITLRSTTEWIWFLNNNQRDMKIKIIELEKRIRELEWMKGIEVIRE